MIKFVVKPELFKLPLNSDEHLVITVGPHD